MGVGDVAFDARRTSSGIVRMNCVDGASLGLFLP